MSTCPKCQAPIVGQLEECPRCGVIFSRIHQDRPLVGAPRSPIHVTRAFALPKKYYLLPLLFLAVWAWHKRSPPKFPDFADQSLAAVQGARQTAAIDQTDPCVDRPYCVYLYVAPWCPHCKEFLPHISQIRGFWQDSSRPGLKVVIGWDKMPAIQEMATQIEPPRFADESEIFRKSLGLKSVPYLLVVDNHRQIVAQGSAAVDWLNDEINTHLHGH
jgi:thiol-disulfide isomerase/thioredoxin